MSLSASEPPKSAEHEGANAAPAPAYDAIERVSSARKRYSASVRRAILPPIIALIGIAGLLVWQVQDLLYAAKQVDHTDRVISQANHTLSLLLDMQAGFRGYLVGGDKRFLASYTSGHAEIRKAFDDLASLTSDNGAQRVRMRDMRDLYLQWEKRSEEEIALRPVLKDYAAHFNIVPTRAIMPQLRTKFSELIGEEERLLKYRQERQNEEHDLFYFVVLSSLLLAPLLGWSTFREMRNLALGYETALDAEQTARENLGATLYGIGDAVMVTDSQGRILRMNPVAETLTKWTEADARGRNVRLVFDIINETTREPVESPVERVIREGVIVGLANHTVLRQRNGAGEIAIDDSGAPVRTREGRLAGVVLVFRDVTERRRIDAALEEAYRRERLVNEVGDAIRNSPLETETILQTAASALGQAIGADRCYYARYDQARDIARLAPEWHRDGLAPIAGDYPMSRFSVNRTTHYRAGETQVVVDVREFSETDSASPEPGPLESLGLRSLIRVPIRAGNAMTALAVAMSSTPRVWTENEIGAVETVASQIQSALETARLLAEEQARTASEHAVARIGEAVLTGADPDEVRRLAAASLGEALGASRCFFLSVDIARESITVDVDWRAQENLPPLSLRYRLPNLNRDIAAIFGDKDGDTLAISDVAAEAEPARRQIMERLELSACLTIPVLTRDRALAGVLGIAMADGPREWTASDIAFAETIAAQTRAAIEAARLQQRERTIATQLQEALVPSPPEAVPGLALASRYIPALDEAGVGGDFLDVFPTGSGDSQRTALVVADLAGKGLAAAAQVATVRNMLRSVLYDAAPLDLSIIRLNDMLVSHSLLTGFATLFAGLYDPITRTLTYVSCGQEPGLLLRAATGAIEELDATGPVLGAFPGASFAERTIPLAPGDLLALFTDGLTEAGPDRRSLLSVAGVSRLLSDAASASDLSSMASTLVERVDRYAQGGARDDVCLLLARCGA